jgi:hypothetical protein
VIRRTSAARPFHSQPASSSTGVPPANPRSPPQHQHSQTRARDRRSAPAESGQRHTAASNTVTNRDRTQPGHIISTATPTLTHDFLRPRAVDDGVPEPTQQHQGRFCSPHPPSPRAGRHPAPAPRRAVQGARAQLLSPAKSCEITTMVSPRGANPPAAAATTALWRPILQRLVDTTARGERPSSPPAPPAICPPRADRCAGRPTRVPARRWPRGLHPGQVPSGEAAAEAISR